jgi:hypothetical protein
LCKSFWKLPVTAPLPDIFPDHRQDVVLLEIGDRCPVGRREESGGKEAKPLFLCVGHHHQAFL